MRILQINSGRHLNGAMVHTFLLSRELVRQGHDVHVVCYPGYWLWDQLAEAQIPCVASTMRRNWSEVQVLRKFVQRQQIDVIHSHMSRAHMFGILLRWASSIPCVATAHCRLFQLHWRWNDFVIANSNATRDFHVRYNRVRPDRIQTVYCTSDLERFSGIRPSDRSSTRQRLGISDEQPLLGIIGEVSKRKGHLHLFRALPEILQHYPHARLVVIGHADRAKAYTRSLRAFLAKYKLYRRVIWTGCRDDIPACMAALDVCVVPSVEEPLGLVAIEAHAAGLPLIVSDAGGLPEIVQRNETGLVVPAGDHRALSTAVCRLLDAPSMAAKFALAGKATVAAHFSLPKLTADVLDVLQRVVSRSTKRAA